MEASSDSEFSDSDRELQDALAQGLLKPGLNKLVPQPRKFVNNTDILKHKLEEIYLDLPWLERLDCVNTEAPLAPELAAQLLTHEQKRENQLKNNKKLAQIKPAEDPVLNDFKREMMFHRQAQAAVLEAIPKLQALGVPTKRPEDYFAEMAKTDEQMQKIRKHLLEQQHSQQRSERVKQLRQQRKDGKMLQIQTKLQRQQEKREMTEKVKKYRKGVSKDLDFLDNKKAAAAKKGVNQKRAFKNKKFGFGGKKRGTKSNTKESAADISDFRKPKRDRATGKGGNHKQNRPGKNRRVKLRNKK